MSSTMSIAEAKKMLLEELDRLENHHEDDLVTVDCYIHTTEQCLSDLSEFVETRERSLENRRVDDNALKSIPPHIIHLFHEGAEDYARDSDLYWERMDEHKFEFYQDEIRPILFPQEDEEDEESGANH